AGGARRGGARGRVGASPGSRTSRLAWKAPDVQQDPARERRIGSRVSCAGAGAQDRQANGRRASHGLGRGDFLFARDDRVSPGSEPTTIVLPSPRLNCVGRGRLRIRSASLATIKKQAVPRSISGWFVVCWSTFLLASIVVGALLWSLYEQSTTEQLRRAAAAVAHGCDAVAAQYQFFISATRTRADLHGPALAR